MKNNMKKRITALVLAALMVFGMIPVSMFTAFAEETEEPAAPIAIEADYSWYDAAATELTISDKGDLVGFAKLTQGAVEGVSEATDSFSGKTVVLDASLTFVASEYWYYNDGTTVYDYRINNFAGTFDGQKNTISGLNFCHTAGTNQNVGLFNTLSADGAVNNLTIDTVNGTFGKEVRYGTIAATLNGDVANCNVKNINITATAEPFRGAGIGYSVGNNGSCSVTDCSVDGFTVNVTGPCALTAGLLGTVKTGTTVTNCDVSNVNITASGLVENTGSLIGKAAGVTVTDCTASTVAITAGTTSCYVGGMIGNAGGVNITNCVAEDITITAATMKGANNGNGGTGGFVGLFDGGSAISECNITNVTLTATESATQVGGFVGCVDTATNTLSNCDANDVKIITSAVEGATINAGNCIGGFVGQTRGVGEHSFDNCNITGLDMQIAGDSGAIGGFSGNLGGNNGTTITNSSVSGTIDTTNSPVSDDIVVGGFASNLGWGQSGSNEFTGCAADTDIEATGTAGGFIGQAQSLGGSGTDTKVTVTDSTASGDVVTTGVAGGFVGTASSGIFDSCEATGSVSGDVAGGFAGEIIANTSTAEDKNITISDSTANGVVLGTTNASGFVGTVTTATKNEESGEAENNTAVKIENSNAASLVAGATKDTVVSEFVTVKDEDVAEGETGNFTAESNTEAKETLKNLDDEKTLTMENGTITAPAGTTVQFGSDSAPTVSTGAPLASAREFVVTTDADNSEVVIGETVTVTVTLNGTDLVGAKWTLVYDDTKFELISGVINGQKVAGTGNTFGASEVMATYVFKAIVQQPDGIAAAFSVTNCDAWDLREANKGDSIVISKVTPVNVTTVNPAYEVVVDTENDYVAGKKLVLVYTNSPDVSFTYASAAMYDVSTKYKKDGYAYSFAIVVDAAESYAENVAVVPATVASEYVIDYDKNDYDINDSDDINLRDVTVVFGVYNGTETTFANYMNIVLNADINADGVVNGTDTDAFVRFVRAYTAE